MANSPQEQWARKEGSLRRSLRESLNAGAGTVRETAPASKNGDEDDWDAPADRLEHTSADENANILASLRGGETEAGEVDPAEVEKLESENEQLRGIVEELHQQLEDMGKGGDSEREREFEAMLEEKTERIRELHARIRELETGGSEEPAGPKGDGPGDDELVALSDELERERCQLERERQQLEDDRMQLREDEESMMRQMRDMELQMAKERAELARQRNELQRLHSEIRHELELAQRDAAVNERLKMLQRKTMLEAPAAGSGSGGNSGTVPVPRKKSMTGNVPVPPKKKDSGSGNSGFFGRFFGGK
jgi:predicted RNase H-like nuclease (RuvC/YqgF family)